MASQEAKPTGGRWETIVRESNAFELSWWPTFHLIVRNAFYPLSTIADTVEVRDEQTLRDYFDYYLHRHLARSNNMPIPKETPRISKEGARYAVSRPSTQQSHIGFNEVVKKRNHPKTNDEKASKSPDFTDAPARASGETQAGDSDLLWESEVHEVILVRKLGPLANLRDRRQKVLRQLEVVSVFQTLSWSH